MISPNSSSKGYVYILINISMPGLVKVGKSTRSPEIRAAELSQASGVPHSFQIVYQTLVDNCDLAEKEVHKFLNPYRENNNREFFRIPVNRAIDVLRKVIVENNLKESDFDIDPYRFSYEEFHSAEALFEKVISNENYWEQAKLHLKGGHLLNWLKKKSEFDALVNADHFKDKSDDLDFYFSLIVFSVLPGKFRIFGYELGYLLDIHNFYEREFNDEEKFPKLLLSGKLFKVYQGYLNAKKLEDDSIVTWLKFTNWSLGKPYQDRKVRVKAMLKWKVKSSNFLFFNSMSYEKSEYLIDKTSWTLMSEVLGIPSDIKEKALSQNEDDVIESVKYLKVVEKILTGEESSSSFSKFGKKDLIVLLPKEEYLNELKRLNGKEYLSFLECAITIEEFKKMDEEYLLPENLVSTLFNPLTFYEFLIVREMLRYFLGNCKNNFVGATVFKRELMMQFEPYLKILAKEYSYIEADSTNKIAIRNKIFNPKNFQLFENQIGVIVKLKSHFSYRRGFVFTKTEIKEKVKKITEEYIIPHDIKNKLLELDLSTLEEFLSEFSPKIKSVDLDDRVIHQTLLFSIKNGLKRNYQEAFFLLSKTFPSVDNSQKVGNKIFEKTPITQIPMGLHYSMVSTFSLEFIPTNIFLSNLVLPSELTQQLRSNDLESYIKGLTTFFKQANNWIPKKTLKAIEEIFIIPHHIQMGIIGYGVNEYIQSINFLKDLGLEIVNGLEKDNIIFRTKGFLRTSEGSNKRLLRRSLRNSFPERGNYNSKPFSFFEKGRLSYRTELNESISKVNKLLADSNVDKTFLVWYENDLIQKKELLEYQESVGQGGFSHFNLIYDLNSCNHTEAKKIIIAKYDKRLDKTLNDLKKEIRVKFQFLPNGLIELLTTYLDCIKIGEIGFSESDKEFIRGLKKYAELNSFSLMLKKKSFHQFLKEHNYQYREKGPFGESFLNYISENC
ncbi:GIY-YIG nuclease family protein [Cognataquiflexum rubidum]|uniref:GIY-YIG nuclease family protein n=1 Tax=Cognataquiflexum rubidum TaxID=2922273 RepID=UPI001F135783|nr:GIY-YIG nuclease family protein [Cognataquiflexum rubidum]MCH6234501.1 GIY-YIG nuclease family protein [Cognataquiflexum rubidum]